MDDTITLTFDDDANDVGGMCKLRPITDPARVGAVRVGIARTIRQVERMLKQYSVQEIAEANAFLDDGDK
jgi:hypothetical protein